MRDDELNGTAVDLVPVFCDPITDVATFQQKMGHSYLGPPRLGDSAMRAFRIGFMLEELKETAEALGVTIDVSVRYVAPEHELGDLAERRRRLAAVLDGLADLDYVLIGTLHQLGLQDGYGEAFCRVHAANMRKEIAIGEAKSVRKPRGWEAPELGSIIDDLIARYS